MTITLEDFQAASRSRTIEPGKRPQPYNAELRAFARGYAREHIAAGKTQTAVLGELGISYQTLRTWRSAGGERSTGFRRVTIMKEVAEANSVTMVSPKGYRVEGLRLDDVASLLERLG